MRRGRAAFEYSVQLTRLIALSGHTALVMMAFAVFAMAIFDPLAAFARNYQQNVCAWAVLPLLTGGDLIQFAVLLGAVLLVGGSPFVGENHAFVMMRVDRRLWSAGQVLAVMWLSALYFAFVTLICWALLLPNLSFANDWGKIVRTLSSSMELPDDITIRMSAQVIRFYTPMQAMALSLCLNWLVGTFLGLLILLVNSASRSRFGLLVGAAAVMFQVTVDRLFALPKDVLLFFSPTALANIGTLDQHSSWRRPGPGYAIAALAGACILLGALYVGWAGGSNRMHEWLLARDGEEF